MLIMIISLISRISYHEIALGHISQTSSLYCGFLIRHTSDDDSDDDLDDDKVDDLNDDSDDDLDDYLDDGLGDGGLTFPPVTFI